MILFDMRYQRVTDPHGYFQFKVLYNGEGVSELLIAAATPGDSGNYSCVPSNAEGASVAVHVIAGGIYLSD